MKILSQCTYNPEIEAIEVRGELTGRDAIDFGSICTLVWMKVNVN
jgi:hypothetical protein